LRYQQHGPPYVPVKAFCDRSRCPNSVNRPISVGMGPSYAREDIIGRNYVLLLRPTCSYKTSLDITPSRLQPSSASWAKLVSIPNSVGILTVNRQSHASVVSYFTFARLEQTTYNMPRTRISTRSWGNGDARRELVGAGCKIDVAAHKRAVINSYRPPLVGRY